MGLMSTIGQWMKSSGLSMSSFNTITRCLILLNKICNRNRIQGTILKFHYLTKKNKKRTIDSGSIFLRILKHQMMKNGICPKSKLDSEHHRLSSLKQP